MEKECNKFLICMPAPKHPAFPPGTRVTRHSWRARRRRRRRARTAAFAHRGLAASSTPATPASEDDRTCPHANRSDCQRARRRRRRRARTAALACRGSEQGCSREASRASSDMLSGRQPSARWEQGCSQDASGTATEKRARRQPICEQGGIRDASRFSSRHASRARV